VCLVSWERLERVDKIILTCLVMLMSIGINFSMKLQFVSFDSKM
jgi:hypothetical protein